MECCEPSPDTGSGGVGVKAMRALRCHVMGQRYLVQHLR
jgi:hypothetical protein